MVKIAIDMLHQGYIDEQTALRRCDAEKLDELLHPVFDKSTGQRTANHTWIASLTRCCCRTGGIPCR